MEMNWIGYGRIISFMRDSTLRESILNIVLNRESILYLDVFQIYTVNGRSLTRSNHVASNGVVHTVDRFVYSASWASCGRYIEASPQLTELEEALDRVGLLAPLFGGF